MTGDIFQKPKTVVDPPSHPPWHLDSLSVFEARAEPFLKSWSSGKLMAMYR